MASSHVPSLEPVLAPWRGAVKDSPASPTANMRSAESPHATRNRPLASRLSARPEAAVSNVVRGSGRDVKRWRTPSYRISAAANERSWRTVHSSRGEDKKNSHPHWSGDSPRRPHRGRMRPAGAPELARDTETTASGGGFFLARWPDSGGWRSAGSSTGPLRGIPHRSNGSADAQAKMSDHSPSANRFVVPFASRRLAKIAPVGDLEMGPRESQLPNGQVSLRSANFAARRFFYPPPPSPRAANPSSIVTPYRRPPSTPSNSDQPPRQIGPATNRH